MAIIKTTLKGLGLVLLIALIIPVGYFSLQETNVALKNVKINNDYEQGSIGAYIINLDRSPERLAQITPQIAALDMPFERFPAVDGGKLSQQKIDETVDFDLHHKQINNHPKRGTIGCTLSHIGAWQQFLESDHEFGFFIEDDMSIDVQAMKDVIAELKTKTHLWDVVTFYPSYDGMPLTINRLQTGHNLVVYLFEIGCTGLYILNRTAAKAYLSKALPMTMSIDHMYTRNWEFGLKFVGIENPRIGRHGFDESTIGASAETHDESWSLYDRVYRGLFKLQTYVAKFIYNLKLYLTLKE